jgi:hypothetical protein
VLLVRDHEGIIVLEQLQPLTLWLVSIPISRQRLTGVSGGFLALSPRLTKPPDTVGESTARF